MIEQFAQAIVRWRYLVVLATFGIILTAASGARFLGFDTDYRVFFSEGNPQLEAFDKLQDTYTKQTAYYLC